MEAEPAQFIQAAPREQEQSREKENEEEHPR